MPCARDRSSVIRQNLKRLLPKSRLRFLTLTLRSEGQPLTDLLDKLLKSFKRLRSRAFWRERVTAGLAVLEVKYIPETKRWHPHLHVLLAGKYLPQPMIKQAWLEITGDSYIVHIVPVNNKNAQIRYVTKYVTKPLDSIVVGQPALLAEAVDALHGRKLLHTFGAWARWKLLEPLTDKSWQHIGHLEDGRFERPLSGTRDVEIRRAALEFLRGSGPNHVRIPARAPPIVAPLPLKPPLSVPGTPEYEAARALWAPERASIEHNVAAYFGLDIDVYRRRSLEYRRAYANRYYR